MSASSQSSLHFLLNNIYMSFDFPQDKKPQKYSKWSQMHIATSGIVVQDGQLKVLSFSEHFVDLQLL
jgi:hypothetical protein